LSLDGRAFTPPGMPAAVLPNLTRLPAASSFHTAAAAAPCLPAALWCAAHMDSHVERRCLRAGVPFNASYYARAPVVAANDSRGAFVVRLAPLPSRISGATRHLRGRTRVRHSAGICYAASAARTYLAFAWIPPALHCLLPHLFCKARHGLPQRVLYGSGLLSWHYRYVRCCTYNSAAGRLVGGRSHTAWNARRTRCRLSSLLWRGGRRLPQRTKRTASRIVSTVRSFATHCVCELYSMALHYRLVCIYAFTASARCDYPFAFLCAFPSAGSFRAWVVTSSTRLLYYAAFAFAHAAEHC